jgi:hypothetical protein
MNKPAHPDAEEVIKGIQAAFKAIREDCNCTISEEGENATQCVEYVIDVDIVWTGYFLYAATIYTPHFLLSHYRNVPATYHCPPDIEEKEIGKFNTAREAVLEMIRHHATTCALMYWDAMGEEQ